MNASRYHRSRAASDESWGPILGGPYVAQSIYNLKKHEIGGEIR